MVLTTMDLETGVIYGEEVVFDWRKDTKKENKEDILDSMENRSAVHSFIIDELGNFSFCLYDNIFKLELERQYLFRFVYLCTHLSYKGDLRWENSRGENSKIKEKDLMQVLKLSQNETIRTKKALLMYDLISIKDDKSISINPNYCVKGSIKNKIQLIKGGIRMMENGIKFLYEDATAIQHKKLALLIELLPHINFQYNVICSNPAEDTFEDIKPLNMTEIMNIVNYKNVTTLKRDLLKLRVNEKLVVAITETDYGKFVSINPMVYYKGTRMQSLDWLCGVYKIGKNK